MPYQPEKAVAYARKWAYGRNPAYYNFDSLGGDCTNFISQCLHAGGCRMNYKKDVGWFFNSLRSRSAAWTGVPYLHNFLVSNKGPGPYGQEADVSMARVGDIIQLSFDGSHFGHTLFIVSVGQIPALDNILIATHTMDSLDRPLSTYFYEKHRLIRIEGTR